MGAFAISGEILLTKKNKIYGDINSLATRIVKYKKR